MKYYITRMLSLLIAVCVMMSISLSVGAVDGMADSIYGIEYANVASDKLEFEIGFDNTYVPISCQPIGNVVSPISGVIVDQLQVLEDFTPAQKALVREEESSLYPLASLLWNPTPYFNCHSYAWYSQDVDQNDRWMPWSSYYYYGENTRYLPVLTPNVGDVICYIAANGANIHSGIVVGSSGEASNGLCGNSNMYIVESKWAEGGLYRHNGYECPYTAYNPDPEPGVSPAVNVRFYRANYTLVGETAIHNTHSFTTYNDFNNLYYHESGCECGLIIHQPHLWEIDPAAPAGLNYVPLSVCAHCGATAFNPPSA